METFLQFLFLSSASLTGFGIWQLIERLFLTPSTIKRIMLAMDREYPESSNVYARVFAKRVTDEGFFGDYESAHEDAVDAAAYVERKFDGGPELGFDDADWWKNGQPPD